MSSYSDVLGIPGLVAGGDLSAAQYKVVKFASTAKAVIAVAATTDLAIGILQNDPTSGQEALVAKPGEIAIALAGAADIAAGELLGFNSTGQVADHTTDGRLVIAQALEASTAVNDEISVLLTGLFGYS